MPELPDVQVFKEYLDATSLHRPVESVSVQAERVLDDVSPSTIRRALRGRALTASRRHGKHLFARAGADGRETNTGGEADDSAPDPDGPDGRWLRLHFGMTGTLEAWEGEGEAPDHTRLRLDFADGGRLAYTNPRRFGEIGVVDDPDRFVEEQGLGPDPWADDFDLADFRSRLQGRRGGVKSTLMNQRVLAGLGNVYVDEVLFQRGVAPERAVPELADDELEGLFRTMKDVLRGAVEARAERERFPDDWLTRDRREGRSCPRCGGAIGKREVTGRATYVCDGHQR